MKWLKSTLCKGCKFPSENYFGILCFERLVKVPRAVPLSELYSPRIHFLLGVKLWFAAAMKAQRQPMESHVTKQKIRIIRVRVSFNREKRGKQIVVNEVVS